MSDLVLVSHVLCPYVQRAAIVLAEKEAAFVRRGVALSNKPDWFLAVSPLGKTPVLLVGGVPLFESAVICEYLDETIAPRLLHADPLARARERAWIAFASATLDAIAALYNARVRRRSRRATPICARSSRRSRRCSGKGCSSPAPASGSSMRRSRRCSDTSM